MRWVRWPAISIRWRRSSSKPLRARSRSARRSMPRVLSARPQRFTREMLRHGLDYVLNKGEGPRADLAVPAVVAAGQFELALSPRSATRRRTSGRRRKGWSCAPSRRSRSGHGRARTGCRRRTATGACGSTSGADRGCRAGNPCGRSSRGTARRPRRRSWPACARTRRGPACGRGSARRRVSGCRGLQSRRSSASDPARTACRPGNCISGPTSGRPSIRNRSSSCGPSIFTP